MQFQGSDANMHWSAVHFLVLIASYASIASIAQYILQSLSQFLAVFEAY